MTEYRVPTESRSENEGNAASLALSAIETEKLLASDPAAAEIRARKILAERPGNLGALMLLGAALRRQGDFTAAEAVLEPLTKAQPELVLAHYELGLALGALGNYGEGIRVLARAIDLVPNFA